MSNIHLKHTKHLDNLVSFVENNEYKNAETLINCYPEVLTQKCSDGDEVVYFVIRNKSNKLFRLILKKLPLVSSHNLPKMLSEIIKSGTAKMLRIFANHFKLELDNKIYHPYVDKMLSQTDIFHEFILTETNIRYCFSIPNESFAYMEYTCPSIDVKDNKEGGVTKKMIYINKREDSDEMYNLDSYTNPYLKKKSAVFYRYEKFFLVMKKSTIPIKTVKDSILKEIVKYI